MKTTKKLLAVFLCALTVASLAACGCKNTAKTTAASSTSSAEQIADPFIECKTLEEAEKVSGVTIAVPTAITDEFSSCVYRAMENSMIEIVYTNGKDGDEIRIRKGLGKDDVSGDYNNYAEASTVTIGSSTITFKGDNGKVSLAVWIANDHAYSVNAASSGTGIAKTGMTDIVNSIDQTTADSGEQIANPFTECATMQEAAKIAGVEMTVPETVKGYSERVIQAVNNEMIQVSFMNGDDQLIIRKAAGSNDISGDYNDYPETSTVKVGDLSVTLKGNDGTVGVALWTNGGYTYAIDTPLAGVSESFLTSLIQSIN